MTHSQAVTGPRLFPVSFARLCLLLLLSPPTHSLTHSSGERASGRGQSDHDDKTLACCTLIGGFELCNQCHCR